MQNEVFEELDPRNRDAFFHHLIFGLQVGSAFVKPVHPEVVTLILKSVKLLDFLRGPLQEKI
jgi:hypothetical protein